MLSFREFPTPEAQFPRRPPLGRWVNRGNLPRYNCQQSSRQDKSLKADPSYYFLSSSCHTKQRWLRGSIKSTCML
jgi:hypothetical protein